MTSTPAMPSMTIATRPPRRRKGGGPREGNHLFAYIVAVLLAATVIVPVLYVVLGGFRTTPQLNANPVGLPTDGTISNYTFVLSSGDFWRQVFNSTLIAVVVTTVVVMFGSGAAYALSRYRFRGNTSLYTFFTLGLLFPVGVGVLPLYLLVRYLGLLDTPFGVAIPEAAFGLPVTIVILRPFMAAIPSEIEDAAFMDGCGRVGFFWRIMVPLAKPALTTVAILSFVTSWNNFILPLVLLNDPNQWTLPLGTATFSTTYTQDTAKILAFTALSMVPALTFFVLAERRIIGGLSGAVKG
jgi:raffinose/stachyose/melibiose transport system permease protein